MRVVRACVGLLVVASGVDAFLQAARGPAAPVAASAGRAAAAASRAAVSMMSSVVPDGIPRIPPIGYTGPPGTPLLDTVNLPADLNRFTRAELKQLTHELRWDVIRTVAGTGGHLGSSLGVVELTVALHYVFEV